MNGQRRAPGQGPHSTFSGHLNRDRWTSEFGDDSGLSKWPLSTAVSQMWTSLDCSYYFQCLLDLRKLPSRRKTIEGGCSERRKLRRGDRSIIRVWRAQVRRAIRSCAVPAYARRRWRSGTPLAQARELAGSRFRNGNRRARDAGRFECAMAQAIGGRQRFVEDGYGAIWIAGLGLGFRQGNLYETVKNQDVLRA